MVNPENTSNPTPSSKDPWADVEEMLSKLPEQGGASRDGTTSLADIRRQLGESDTWHLSVQEVILVGAEQDPNTYKSLRAISEALAASGLNPASIYYPASEIFVTITEVFGTDKVIFGEVEPRAVEMLRAGGYTVLEGDMHTTSLPDGQKVDMVYMRYVPPQNILTEAELIERLTPSGYFVTDNQYGQADLVREYYGSFVEYDIPKPPDVPASERLYTFQLH